MKNMQKRKKSKNHQKQYIRNFITFEPIKIQTHSAPQNDRVNLSFVKGINVDG